jgi:chaperonin GroEL (HSP60 family)
MPIYLKNPVVGLFSCGLEIPTPKSKYSLTASNAEIYSQISSYQQDYLTNLIKDLQEKKITVVVSQWSIDKSIIQCFLQHGISAISWLPADQLEYLSGVTGASICSSIHKISSLQPGYAEEISQVQFSNDATANIIVKSSPSSECVIMIRFFQTFK